MNWQGLESSLLSIALHFGGKLLGAVVLWFVGQWVIRFVQVLTVRSVRGRKVDPTIERYIESAVGGILYALLIVILLGFFGVQTTTFAALLGAAGVAIGVAWSGLLSNFAAGVFMILLRPFQVGDSVLVGGITGHVQAIGLFTTVLCMDDNVLVTIGNSKVFGDTIRNFTANPSRRLERTIPLIPTADWKQAAELLREELIKLPLLTKEPAVIIDLIDVTAGGPVVVVRAWALSRDYDQALFALNSCIHALFLKPGWMLPGTLPSS